MQTTTDMCVRRLIAKRVRELLRQEEARLVARGFDLTRGVVQTPSDESDARQGHPRRHVPPSTETSSNFHAFVFELARYQEAMSVPNREFVELFPDLRHSTTWIKMVRGNFAKHYAPLVTKWTPVLQSIVDELSKEEPAWRDRRPRIQASVNLKRAELRQLAWRIHAFNEKGGISTRQFETRYGKLIGSRFTFLNRLLTGQVPDATLDNWLERLRGVKF